MSGWMLEHLTAGEVLDGWNVEGGHCQARNFISVQVKCAVPEADQAQCYAPDGNPYPPRPDGAFTGDHDPGAHAGSSDSQNGPQKYHYAICVASNWDVLGNSQNRLYYFSSIFPTSGVTSDNVFHYDDTVLSPKWFAYIDAHYGDKLRHQAGSCYGVFQTIQQAEEWRANQLHGIDPSRQIITTIEWSSIP